MTKEKEGLEWEACRIAQEWLYLQDGYRPMYRTNYIALGLNPRTLARIDSSLIQLGKNKLLLETAIKRCGDRHVKKVYESLHRQTLQLGSELFEIRGEVKELIEQVKVKELFLC